MRTGTVIRKKKPGKMRSFVAGAVVGLAVGVVLATIGVGLGWVILNAYEVM